MENQRLFDKIRESLTDDLDLQQPTLNWDKTGVWQRIEERKTSSQKRIVWWYAAAGVMLVLGSWWTLSLHFSPQKNTKIASVAKQNILVFKQPNVAKKLLTQTQECVSPVPFVRKDSTSKSEIIIDKPRVLFDLDDTTQIANNQLNNETEKPDLIMDMASNLDSVNVHQAVALTQNAEIPMPKERILIVDIYLPEVPIQQIKEAIQTTFLERFSIQSKRFWKYRKFDIRALDSRPDKGLWSAIAHSIVVPTTNLNQ